MSRLSVSRAERKSLTPSANSARRPSATGRKKSVSSYASHQSRKGSKQQSQSYLTVLGEFPQTNDDDIALDLIDMSDGGYESGGSRSETPLRGRDGRRSISPRPSHTEQDPSPRRPSMASRSSFSIRAPCQNCKLLGSTVTKLKAKTAEIEKKHQGGQAYIGELESQMTKLKADLAKVTDLYEREQRISKHATTKLSNQKRDNEELKKESFKIDTFHAKKVAQVMHLTVKLKLANRRFDHLQAENERLKREHLRSKRSMVTQLGDLKADNLKLVSDAKHWSNLVMMQACSTLARKHVQRKHLVSAYKNLTEMFTHILEQSKRYETRETVTAEDAHSIMRERKKLLGSDNAGKNASVGALCTGINGITESMYDSTIDLMQRVGKIEHFLFSRQVQTKAEQFSTEEENKAKYDALQEQYDMLKTEMKALKEEHADMKLIKDHLEEEVEKHKKVVEDSKKEAQSRNQLRLWKKIQEKEAMSIASAVRHMAPFTPSANSRAANGERLSMSMSPKNETFPRSPPMSSRSQLSPLGYTFSEKPNPFGKKRKSVSSPSSVIAQQVKSPRPVSRETKKPLTKQKSLDSDPQKFTFNQPVHARKVEPAPKRSSPTKPDMDFNLITTAPVVPAVKMVPKGERNKDGQKEGFVHIDHDKRPESAPPAKFRPNQTKGVDGKGWDNTQSFLTVKVNGYYVPGGLHSNDPVPNNKTSSKVYINSEFISSEGYERKKRNTANKRKSRPTTAAGKSRPMPMNKERPATTGKKTRPKGSASSSSRRKKESSLKAMEDRLFNNRRRSHDDSKSKSQEDSKIMQKSVSAMLLL